MLGNIMVARKCTCLVDTESDSEEDMPLSTPRTTTTTATTTTTPIPSAVPSARELRRNISGHRDPISTSTALHNSEALRQAHVLQNVFCACYDVDTVISLVQRRERTLSPVQMLLLKQESIKTVFRYATSIGTATLSSSGASGGGTSSGNQRTAPAPRGSGLLRLDPEQYRRSFVATEIVLKFYLKAMAWQGQPKVEAPPAPLNVVLPPTSPRGSYDQQPQDGNGMLSPTRRRFSADLTSVGSSSHRPLLTFGSTLKGKAQRSRSQIPSSQYPLTDALLMLEGNSAEPPSDDPAVRGYLLRLEDLTESEWIDIFAQLYRFLWSEGSLIGAISESATTTSDAGPQVLDSILIANLCKITKSFVVFPAIHKILMEMRWGHGDSVEESGGKGESVTLLSGLAGFVHSPEIATLVHGLIHLAQRRQYPFDPIIQSLVGQMTAALFTQRGHRNSGSSTSSAGSGMSTSSSSSSSSIFHMRRSRFHDRITACADILTKILTQQFPNTFRYYIQSKVQLASFESVEPFEREMFPPKVTPSDPSLHADIKSAVLTALLEDPTTLMQLAEISLAEIRYLNAYHSHLSSGIPPVLVVDVIRAAIECSFQDRTQLELFLPCVQRLIETLCPAINFHQHMSTISEFASRDCFSDSDSEDEDESSMDDSSSDGGNFTSSSDDDGDDDDVEHKNEESDGKPTVSDTAEPLPQQGQLPSRIRPLDLESLTVKEATGALPPPSVCFSPTSGREIVNHRPLTSILLVMHVVDTLDAIIRMGIDAIDNRLMRLDLSTSLIELFERYPSANVLHCRLLKLFLNLFDRNTTGRVNNPFLRSVFRPPHSIQEFIMKKLHKSPKPHPYDAHVAILGVKIDKICSATTLQQELIRQYCHKTPGWQEFASSLVARHYQQMDALDDLAITIGAGSNNNQNTPFQGGRRSIDGMDDVFPLSRPSSSSCDFLAGELQPFRRLPMEKEGIGSSQNLASATEAVRAADMIRSRTQSQYPQSILDIMRNDTSTSFDATEDATTITGYAYQKLAKWVKVQLKFDKSTCLLICQEVPMPSTAANSASSTSSSSSPFASVLLAARQSTSNSATSSPTGAAHSAKKASMSLSTSKLKQLWQQHKPQWTSRPKKFVVINARQWIAFGRTVKNPDVGAFGFQIDVFDRIREEDQTLTFVTRSEKTRTQWFQVLHDAVSESRTARESFSGVDEEANILLVKSVATQREGAQMLYLAVPVVHVLGPVVSPSFTLKSEVPEEIPFWGTFHGVHGVSKYCSLFNRCLRIVSVQEKRVYASGYSVIVEFDATLQAIDVQTPTSTTLARHNSGSTTGQHSNKPTGRQLHALQIPAAATDEGDDKTVTCSFTDTYVVSGNQIVSLTRTIADSEKLAKLLCDDEGDASME